MKDEKALLLKILELLQKQEKIKLNFEIVKKEGNENE